MKIELDSSQNHYHYQHARPAPGLREASRGDIDMMRETPDHLRENGVGISRDKDKEMASCIDRLRTREDCEDASLSMSDLSNLT